MMDNNILGAVTTLLASTHARKGKNPEFDRRMKDYEMKKKRKATITSISRSLSKTGVGRNSPCPCGSGLKYKKCHIPRFEDESVEIKTILDELNLRYRAPEKEDD